MNVLPVNCSAVNGLARCASRVSSFGNPRSVLIFKVSLISMSAPMVRCHEYDFK